MYWEAFSFYPWRRCLEAVKRFPFAARTYYFDRGDLGGCWSFIMEHQREEEKRAWEAGEAGYQVVKVARRVYVGNLAWKTSWQDLKVSLNWCNAYLQHKS